MEYRQVLIQHGTNGDTVPKRYVI